MGIHRNILLEAYCDTKRDIPGFLASQKFTNLPFGEHYIGLRNAKKSSSWVASVKSKHPGLDSSHGDMTRR